MLTVKHKTPDLPLPLIAEDDIPVYKIICKGNKSMHQGFQYRPNATFRLRKRLRPKDTMSSQEKLEHIKRELQYWGTAISGDKEWKSFFYKGFHSWDAIIPEAVKLSQEFKLVHFVIPKGARYYKGTSGDIVSTSLHANSLKKIKVDKL